MAEYVPPARLTDAEIIASLQRQLGLETARAHAAVHRLAKLQARSGNRTPRQAAFDEAVQRLAGELTAFDTAMGADLRRAELRGLTELAKALAAIRGRVAVVLEFAAKFRTTTEGTLRASVGTPHNTSTGGSG